MTRPTKRSIPPAPRPPRPTRRGITAPVVDDAEPEPFFSSRPTRRELNTPSVIPSRPAKVTNIRGQFSISSVKNVGANAISGEIEPVARKRSPTRSQPPPMERVKLVSSTKKSITLKVDGRELTLDRQAAIELASTIFIAFGS